jgi:hypothetical protein
MCGSARAGVLARAWSMHVALCGCSDHASMVGCIWYAEAAGSKWFMGEVRMFIGEVRVFMGEVRGFLCRAIQPVAVYSFTAGPSHLPMSHSGTGSKCWLSVSAFSPPVRMAHLQRNCARKMHSQRNSARKKKSETVKTSRQARGMLLTMLWVHLAPGSLVMFGPCCLPSSLSLLLAWPMLVTLIGDAHGWRNDGGQLCCRLPAPHQAIWGGGRGRGCRPGSARCPFPHYILAGGCVGAPTCASGCLQITPAKTSPKALLSVLMW